MGMIKLKKEENSSTDQYEISLLFFSLSNSSIKKTSMLAPVPSEGPLAFVSLV